MIIGAAGIGGAKEAESNLNYLRENNLGAAEVSFTHSTYLKKEDAIRIGKIAEKLNIKLSIHGSYYINLNAIEKEKITKSKERILKACQIGEYLKATHLVFHPGYYGKDTKEKTYENIKNEMLDLQKTIKKNNWKIKLAPETTGKINVFGDLNETLQLVKDTKCSFCVDFAHLKARNQGKLEIKEIIKKIKPFKQIHCHYSGINYGPKGERNHIPIDKKETKELLKEIKNLPCTIICEAPDTYEDAIKIKKILEKI
ncbi:TIM barrel protein [Candidatus Woesearchaeota archaeon]|jgi:deoxyribonuclease IV|nr:TIM barrel protein [Candidatus Woesearchaeota archaeon]MBT7237375.1 TIM barrel protein [Candidatus Woesearchaeota archaeon]